MKQLGSHWTDFNDISFLMIFRKYVEKIHFLLKSDKNKGYLHEDISTFMIISRSILLRMRNVSDKVGEKIKTHFMSNNFFP